MNSLFTVARYSIVRAMRDKAFFLTLAAGLLGLVLLAGVGGTSTGTQGKLTRELGLVFMEVVSLLVGVTLVLSTVGPDFSGAGLHLSLARPLGRAHYLLGRWLGLATMMLGNFVILGGVLMIVLLLQGSPQEGLVATWGCSLMKLTLISAFLILISTRVSAYVGGTVTVVAWIAMHGTDLVGGTLAGTGSGGYSSLVQTLFALIPDFSHYSLEHIRATEGGVPPAYFVVLGAYTLVYTALFLGLAIANLEDRDL